MRPSYIYIYIVVLANLFLLSFYIYMTGSQCCTAEIGINTVNQLYFNKKKSLGISIYKYSQMIFFFFFCFVGLHLWRMEVPRLGVKS